MTDQRNDGVLERAIGKLPRGSGVVFRHYHLENAERKIRFANVKPVARRHGHILLLADHPSKARKWGADGVHGRHWKRTDTAGLIHSAPVHDTGEIRQAKKNGADLFFLSPAFASQSHPGARPLNLLQLRQLNNLCAGPVILLGGMDQKRFFTSNHLDAHGWAAIDALSRIF